MPLCRLEVVRIEGYGAGVMCPFAVKREVFCAIIGKIGKVMFACNRFIGLNGGICRIPALKVPPYFSSLGFGCNRKGRLCAITAFFLFLLCRQFRILGYLLPNDR